MLKPITQKITDESGGGVYRFTFYCDICGNAKQSHPIISETAGYSILVDPAEREREHDDAYERANREMIRSFNRCPVCKRFVCDDCFYLLDDKYLCKECNAKKDSLTTLSVINEAENGEPRLQNKGGETLKSLSL